jgi:hypothetical protein
MASSIEIVSNALILIGDNPISSFTEPGAGATAAANLYSDTYKQLLSEHPWSFALKEQKLNRLSQSPDSLTNWKYAYQNPTELIRYWAVMPHSDYAIVGSYVYSNQAELLARYVFAVAESQLPPHFQKAFAVAESQLPPHFQKALEYKLAADFALLVTEDQNKSQIFEQKYRMAIGQARSIDSQSHPQLAIIDQPFTDVRNNGTATYF